MSERCEEMSERRSKWQSTPRVDFKVTLPNVQLGNGAAPNREFDAECTKHTRHSQNAFAFIQIHRRHSTRSYRFIFENGFQLRDVPFLFQFHFKTWRSDVGEGCTVSIF